MTKVPEKKRSVFIDLRYLKYLTNGFGQLSLFYAGYFLQNPHKFVDLDITLLVPKEFVNKFGHHVKYVPMRKIYKVLPFLLPKFDIAHSISQQIKYAPVSDKTFRIVTVHDLNFLYEKTPTKAKKRLKATQSRIDLADMITVISKFTRKEIEIHLDPKNTPIVLNYNGVLDLTNLPAEQPYFINTDRKFFFTIGQILAKKNFHVLLDLMKLMPEYDLYICGDDTNKYAQEIQKRLDEEKPANVFMTGVIGIEDKIWMYRNCHAFLFPSKFEGFGIPVIEAMSFGKPVFSSRLTSLDEIGDKYAFFWDNFEPEHMKSVIDKNLSSFYENEEGIEEQKKYALSFSLEEHIERFLEIYRTVVLKEKGSILATLKNYISLMKA